MLYYFKGKPYKILYESKIKLPTGHTDGKWEWQDVVIYECQYENPDGQIWVRLKSNFFENFKPE